MRNVDMKVEGQELVIRIDLSQSQGPSKSGKTIIIASTDGNIELESHPGVCIGMNVYKRR